MHALRGWRSYRPVVQPETRAPARGETWKEAGVLSSFFHRLLQLCGRNSRVEFSRATLINCGQSLILCCLPSPSAKVKWVPSPSLSGAQSSGILEILGLGCQHPSSGSLQSSQVDVYAWFRERRWGKKSFSLSFTHLFWWPLSHKWPTWQWREHERKYNSTPPSILTSFWKDDFRIGIHFLNMLANPRQVPGSQLALFLMHMEFRTDWLQEYILWSEFAITSL